MSAPQSNLSNWTIGQQHHPIRTGSRAIWSFRPLCQIAVTQNLTPYTTGEGFGYSKRSHRLPCHRLADGQSGAPFSWLVDGAPLALIVMAGYSTAATGTSSALLRVV